MKCKNIPVCGRMQAGMFYRKGDYLSNLEYPLPYCTHRETRLKVAEEMDARDMT